MQTVILCLEKIGIGGVETSVINQAVEYKRRGYKVVILAGSGIYCETLKNLEISFENFDFNLNNNFDNKRINDFIKIIKKYNPMMVVINQFPCILYALPACYITNTPYVAYIHAATKMIKNDEYNVFDWYENTFDFYKELFPLYFKNAIKIISISEKAADYVKNKYSITNEKFIIYHNSINFDMYKSNEKSNNRKKFLLISRLSNEKIKSIQNTIDLFKAYENNEKSLDIVGDGEQRKLIEDYIDGYKNINLLGAKTDIKEIIDAHDVVIGLDRTILEAVAMKKIAVIIGYDNIKQIVDKDNIEKEVEEGFSGESLETTAINELARQIKERNINIDYNYNYIKSKLNIRDNIFELKEKIKTEYSIEEIFNLIEKLNDNNKLLKETLYKEQAFNKSNQMLNEENLELKEENKKLEEELKSIKAELQSVYNSKRYKLINKIAKIIKH